MKQPKTRPNPFYFLVGLAGVAFALTATAYLVMTYRGLSPDAAREVSGSGRGLLDFMDRHGFATMMAEIGVLAVLIAAAMATDSRRLRAERQRKSP